MDLQVTEVGDGPLVVFVHGVLSRGVLFDRVVDRLAGECRMRWYDRRGYGDSADLGEVGVDTHAADLLDVLAGEPAVIVGHSFGGVTVMGAAVRAPELVRAIVLYETSVAWSPGWDDTAMAAMFAAANPVDAGLRLMLGDRLDALGPDELERWRRDCAAFLAEERSVRTGTPPYDVADIRAPMVYGRSDPAMMPSVSAFLAPRIAHLELVTIPGAGHNGHRTEPKAFAAMVRRGLQLAG